MFSTALGAPGEARGLALDWGTVYWRRLSDGTIVAGGFRGLDRDDDSACELDVNPAVQDAVAGFLADTLRGAALPPVRRRWAAVMDETPDDRPIVGPLDDAGPWVVALGSAAMACRAFALTPRRLAALCDGRASNQLDAFRISRFEHLTANTASCRTPAHRDDRARGADAEQLVRSI